MSTNRSALTRDLSAFAQEAEEGAFCLTRERLRAHFLSDRYLVRSAVLGLSDALCVARSGGSVPSSFIQAMDAIELIVRRAFLQPIILGMLRNVAGSLLIARLMASANESKHLVEVAFRSLSDVVGFDVWNFRRVGAQEIVWVEIRSLKTLRAAVIEEHEIASPSDAGIAISVCTAVLHELLPRVLESIGLRLDEQGRICGDATCSARPH